MTSANAFKKLWKSAKKPASQITSDMVESFMSRSRIEGRSRDEIVVSEFRRTGAAY